MWSALLGRSPRNRWYYFALMKKRCFSYASIFLTLAVIGLSSAQAQTPSPHPIVLHAARLLDIEDGKIVAPAEILVQGERIVEVGTTVSPTRTSCRTPAEQMGGLNWSA